MTARPVVTMDDDCALWIDGQYLGEYADNNGQVQPRAMLYGYRSGAQFRAIADFLEQLEGANLLSGISEAGE